LLAAIAISLVFSIVVVNVPAKIFGEGFIDSIRDLGQIDRHAVLETIVANIVE